jgi:putative toxin-antitoxin system antitoxin component (TIGR02293 family)
LVTRPAATDLSQALIVSKTVLLADTGRPPVDLEFSSDRWHISTANWQQVRNDVATTAKLKSETEKLPPLKRVIEYFGGPKTLDFKPSGPFEAHELLLRGIPTKAMVHLIITSPAMKHSDALNRAFGFSTRTMHRIKARPAKSLLNYEQSSRVWKFAEILAQATEVFGSRSEAEKWLEQPAMALEGRKPIDLLATSVGVEIVENHLTRLEYGVYT